MVIWAAQSVGIPIGLDTPFPGRCRLALGYKGQRIVFRRGQSLFDSLAFTGDLEFPPRRVSAGFQARARQRAQFF